MENVPAGPTIEAAVIGLAPYGLGGGFKSYAAMAPVNGKIGELPPPPPPVMFAGNGWPQEKHTEG
jgi:hypothetical protein